MADERVFDTVQLMTVDRSELVALQRSAAMVQPGCSLPVERDVLFALCSEVLEARELLTRLGTDLRAVARRGRETGGEAPRSGPPTPRSPGPGHR